MLRIITALLILVVASPVAAQSLDTNAVRLRRSGRTATAGVSLQLTGHALAATGIVMATSTRGSYVDGNFWAGAMTLGVGEFFVMPIGSLVTAMGANSAAVRTGDPRARRAATLAWTGLGLTAGGILAVVAIDGSAADAIGGGVMVAGSGLSIAGGFMARHEARDTRRGLQASFSPTRFMHGANRATGVALRLTW